MGHLGAAHAMGGSGMPAAGAAVLPQALCQDGPPGNPDLLGSPPALVLPNSPFIRSILWSCRITALQRPPSHPIWQNSPSTMAAPHQAVTP